MRQRNAALAFDAVMRDVLKVNRTQRQVRIERLTKSWERDERLKPMKPFIESWNYWRERYAKHEINSTWMPKNASQIGCMEAIIEICNEHKIDLDLMIACGHRAYARSRYSCTLSMLAANGLDYYAQHSEDVLVELDEEEAQRKAAEWGFEEDDD